jgi:DNA polymerase-3 subunit beta
MRVKVNGEVVGPGECVVSGKMLVGLIRQLDGDITIKISESRVTVKAGDKSYELNTYDPAEYPVFKPDVHEAVEFSIPPQILAEGITATKALVDPDEPRPHFRGVLLDVIDKELNFVGTDTKQLALYRVTGQPDLKDCKVLIPVKAVNVLSGIMQATAPKVLVTKNVIIFSYGNDVVLSSQLLAGVEDFPDYNKVIPADNKMEKVTFKYSELLDTLKRIKVFASERYSKVKLTIAGDNAELKIQSPESGEAVEKIKVDGVGSVEIHFNINAFIDCISTLKGNKVVFGYTNEKSPVTMQTTDNLEHKVVLMPLMSDN